MSKISTYEVAPVPKLSDKLIGTSVGGEIEDITYNFTLLELLELFLPIIPANNLQGVLDYGNTATQDINLFGTITTTNLDVTDTANLFITYLNEETHLLGSLFDSADSVGTAGQVLTSTGDGVEWFTLPPIFTPNLEQVLTEGNTSSIDILLDANLEALDVSADTATVGVNLTLGGTVTDNNAAVGSAGQVLSSTVTGVAWVSLPVYSATSPLLFNSATGVFSIQVANSTQGGYLTANDWVTFDGKQNAGAYITALTGEATATGPGSVPITLNNASVTAKVLTGLNVTGGSISASDSILTAFGKVQSQINGLMGGVQYQGVWDAATNTPTLTSSVGTQGHYYIVNVAGSTDLNGITDWKVGDWAIFSGGTWQKVDNTESVTSVNGQTGAVSLTTDNIPEGATNLYYLDSRARGALSFVAGSGAYNSLTGVITIPTDNNQILNGAGYITLSSISATSPLAYNNLTGVFSIQQADATHNGYLSSTDWSTFNNKQNYLGGTGLVKSTAGTITYITDNSGNWNTAYNRSIISAAVTGTTTKTLTLNEQDGNTITASWTDLDTGLTSVGVSMPSAFSVANSPLTANGTIAVTGAGTTLEYIDGTGALRTFPGLTGYVPYTGATQNVDLGEYGISAGYFQADLTPTGALQVGRMQWNSTDGTMDLRLLGNNVTLQIGQENVTRVVNKSGIDLLEENYQVVRIRKVAEGGAQGQRLAVVLAQGNNENNSTEVIGLVTETILVNQEGFVTSFGEVKSINTTGSLQGETWVDGDILYLSSTVAGQLTNIRPVAPNHSVIVGYVVYAHANNGKIYMAIDTGYELGELHNVYAPSPTANQSIYWNVANSRYQLNTIGGILGYTPANAATTISTTAPLQGGGDLSANRTFSITQSGASTDGYLSSTDWNTFNNKQPAGSYVPTSRQLTINGTAYDLSADRSWSVGTVTSVAALTLGTTGTDLSSSVATGTTTPVITLNVPTASAANRGALSAADWSTFNTKVGGVTATSPLASSGGQTPNITIQQSSGSQDGYLSSTDWTTFNNKQASGNYITSLTGEATGTGPGATAVTLNNASVTAKVLTGINITGGTVQATDTMLTAFGKLQNQINGLIGSTIYQGTWNASTNTPALASGVGVRGYYYIVSVAGNTNLDGITDWFIGDWAIFDGTAWQQVDNTDAVVSVNGQTGAVSLTTDNIPEGATNQYFLNSRARAALSFTAGSGAYNSTTGVITIPTNNNQITNGANYITLASLSGTAPIVYSNTTGAISITQAGTASNGYLSSTDWNTFNNKQGALTLTTTGSSGAATLVGNTLNIPNYGSALTGYVPYTGATANVNLGVYNITTGSTSTFSNASGLSAIFSNGGAAGNYNAIELRGGTAGTAVNWQISKDNTVANAFQIFASTLNGGTTYTTSLFTLANTGYLTLTNGLYAVNETRVSNGAYLSSYQTSLRSIAGAIGVLQLGNNNDNYILVGNTAVGGYLSIRVNVSAESAASGTEALRLAATGAATFYNNLTLSSASSVADLGGVLIVRGNGSAYNTHYLTTGASNVAAYYQYDAAGVAKNLIHAGAASYITGGNFIVGDSTDSGNPYKIQSLGSILVKGNVNDNYSFYNGVYASSTTTINSQFTANWQSSNNWGIGSKGATDSTVYIGNTSAGVISPTGTFTLSVLGNTIVRDKLRVNSAPDDSDIALHILGLSGAGKYNLVGRDSSGTWSFSVATDGSTRIGYPQTGATYKLLTLESSGNNLDTGTVLRLIGNTALDLVDISVSDTTTRIYHQENAADAAGGYGKIQFRTNATPNGSFPTRGGFQFTIGSTDALFIASTGTATFSSSVYAPNLYISPGGGAGSGSDGIVNIQTASSTLGQTSELGLLIKNNGTNGYYSQIGFGYAESRVGAVIAGLITNGGGATSSALIFATRSTTVGSDSPIERMRIPSAGGLWVGTMSRLSTSNSTFKATTASDWAMQIQSPWATAAQNYGLLIDYSAASPNGNGNSFIQCSDSTTTRFLVYSNGTVLANGATFASDVSAANFSTGGNYLITTTSGGYYVYGSNSVARYSYFGYSSGYNGILLGSTTGHSLFFNVDVSGNPSGAFNGGGQEYVWRNAGSFITPNSINNGYNTLLSWNSSGQVTIPGATTIGSLTTASLQIGDYTGSPTLTMAASPNGINKINFYDSNSTEGLYIRTDGESGYGGTMTFGARWDDDEAKIVFKMYQVSAGATYNVRVGIGTGAINPLSMLHVCELDGGNYLGSLRVGGSSGFGIVMDYTQSAYTTATMYASPAYVSNDVIFKLGAGSGNTNQLVLRGNGSIGVNTSAPNTSWGATISNSTLYSSNALRLERNGIAAQGLNISAGGEVVAFDSFNTAIDGLNSAFIWNSTAYNTTTEWMRISNSGFLGLGTNSPVGLLTVKTSPYASNKTPLYIGNTGYTAWNRQSYDTFVLQQDDVTSFRMVEKNGEATTSDQVLSFSIGDGVGRIATSGQPLQFYVNGSPSGLAYQGLSGTQVLAMNTNGNAQFNYALGVTGTVSTTGNYVASSGGIAEIRLQGGGYGGAYNTSLRSLVGAPGVLQFGNNGVNYILAGNTAAGGLLYFRVNCASESTAAGSLALTLNANATAQFESTVTASAFYESSDSRLKTLIKDDYKALGVESVKARLYIKDGKEEIGYYAQDLEAVIPSAVSKNDAGFLSLSYTQVHTAKIAIIEDEVDILKKEVAELKVKLQKYEA